jgi:uncharacterized protein (DUF4415 family)
VSAKKTQEEQLRERINKRTSSTHKALIGIEEDKEPSATIVSPDHSQKVLQNENNLVNQNINISTVETDDNELPTPIKRKPRSKKESEKEKFINKYTARTFYIDPDLLKRFNALSDGIKGEKTRMINEALREYLDTFEEN